MNKPAPADPLRALKEQILDIPCPSGEPPSCATILELIDAALATKPAPADPLRAVNDEVARAVAKFPTWPTDPLHALAVLGEEFGELTKAVLQLTYEPHKTSAEEVRAEAVQTAAMSLRFLASLDAYEYRRGEQHKQGSAP